MGKGQLRLGRKRIGMKWFRVAELSGGGRGRRTIARIPEDSILNADDPQHALMAFYAGVYERVGLPTERGMEAQRQLTRDVEARAERGEL